MASHRSPKPAHAGSSPAPLAIDLGAIEKALYASVVRVPGMPRHQVLLMGHRTVGGIDLRTGRWFLAEHELLGPYSTFRRVEIEHDEEERCT